MIGADAINCDGHNANVTMRLLAQKRPAAAVCVNVLQEAPRSPNRLLCCAACRSATSGAASE